MASIWLTLYLPIFLSTGTLCLDVSEIEVPTNDGISGVFLIQSKTYQYSFDATTAKEACEAIKMRIASKSEVEIANKNGFQTCRFGWVEEQIAVLPRIEKNQACGKNNLGVSVWRADLNKKFDVYCFKPADSEGSLETTSSRPQTTKGARTSPSTSSKLSTSSSSSSSYSSTQFLLQTTSGHPALFQTTTTNKPSVIVSANDGISGVFLIQSETYQYSFDATTAKDACKAVKMRIATRAEVETANKNGFQTCRFGWVEEQIAVLPRVEKNENCGKSSLGVLDWRTDINKKFDVYCFRPEDHKGSLETTSSGPQTTTGGRTSSDNHYSAKTTHPSTMKSTSKAGSTSTTLPPYTSTQSIPFTVSTSPTTSRTVKNPQINNSSQTTISPRSLSSPSTSPKFSTSFSSQSSTQLFLQQTSAFKGHPSLSQTTTPNRPSVRVVPKTLAIISVILVLLLTAGGAAWYLKSKRDQRLPAWIRLRTADIMETEMFKRINERHCQANKDGTYNNILFEIEGDPDGL